MAEIIQNDGGGKKHGKKRPKKHSTHLDMTPMVDLMCLLITFFMLTTAFSKPKAMEITMPEKDNKPDPSKQVKVSADRTINILLSGNDKIYYYKGAIEKGKDIPELKKSDFSKDGIRKILLEKNRDFFKQIAELKEKVTKGELINGKKIQDSTLTRFIKEIRSEKCKFENNKIVPIDHSTYKNYSPIILIKADEKAKYKNVVDIIDEMAICNIGSYAVIDIAPEELKLLETAPK